MLPHIHFLIACAIILPVWLLLFPTGTLSGLALWMLAGGMASAAIDLDVLILVRLKKGNKALKPFMDPVEIYRRFEDFMDAIYDAGILRKAVLTHILLSAAFLVLFWFLRPEYLMPVSIGVLSHLATDAPAIIKEAGKHAGNGKPAP